MMARESSDAFNDREWKPIFFRRGNLNNDESRQAEGGLCKTNTIESFTFCVQSFISSYEWTYDIISF